MKTFEYTTTSKTILADLYTPVGVYMRLRDLYPQSALMESSDYHEKDNSRSFIGIGPMASVAIGQDSSAPATSVAGQASAQGAVTVPLRAVQRRPDGSLFVWSVDKDSRAHRTAVEIGSSIGNGVEILSGLSAGDRFVVEGYQKISEGSKVVY